MSAFVGYDPERLAALRRALGAAIDEAEGWAITDPAASTAAEAVRAAAEALGRWPGKLLGVAGCWALFGGQSYMLDGGWRARPDAGEALTDAEQATAGRVAARQILTALEDGTAEEILAALTVVPDSPAAAGAFLAALGAPAFDDLLVVLGNALYGVEADALSARQTLERLGEIVALSRSAPGTSHASALAALQQSTDALAASVVVRSAARAGGLTRAELDDLITALWPRDDGDLLRWGTAEFETVHHLVGAAATDGRAALDLLTDLHGRTNMSMLDAALFRSGADSAGALLAAAIGAAPPDARLLVQRIWIERIDRCELMLSWHPPEPLASLSVPTATVSYPEGIGELFALDAARLVRATGGDEGAAADEQVWRVIGRLSADPPTFATLFAAADEQLLSAIAAGDRFGVDDAAYYTGGLTEFSNRRAIEHTETQRTVWSAITSRATRFASDFVPVVGPALRIGANALVEQFLPSVADAEDRAEVARVGNLVTVTTIALARFADEHGLPPLPPPPDGERGTRHADETQRQFNAHVRAWIEGIDDPELATAAHDLAASVGNNLQAGARAAH